MPPVKSSVLEHFLKLSKGKDGTCRKLYECTLHMYDSHNDYAKNNDMLHAH